MTSNVSSDELVCKEIYALGFVTSFCSSIKKSMGTFFYNFNHRIPFFSQACKWQPQVEKKSIYAKSQLRKVMNEGSYLVFECCQASLSTMEDTFPTFCPKGFFSRIPSRARQRLQHKITQLSVLFFPLSIYSFKQFPVLLNAYALHS